MELARASKQEEVVVLRSPKSYQYSVSYGQPRLAKGQVYFSPKEAKHLAVAGSLVMGIGLSNMLYPSFFDYGDILAGLWVFGVFAVILTASFLSHEVGHKVTAQRQGLWAEFRLTMWGAILTLISVISPLFKIISPGAVVVSGSSNSRAIGKISVAGPAVNILLSAALFGSAVVSASLLPQLHMILLLAAFLNGFMAVFNLIPVGILDGFKIFSWDKKVWATVFAASVALTIVAYIFMQGLVG
jgi:Zn-dependent protease